MGVKIWFICNPEGVSSLFPLISGQDGRRSEAAGGEDPGEGCLHLQQPEPDEHAAEGRRAEGEHPNSLLNSLKFILIHFSTHCNSSVFTQGQVALRVHPLAGAVSCHEARLHRAQLPHALLQLPGGRQEERVLRRGPQGDLRIHHGW